jgi:predicted lipoprotein
MSPRNLRVCCLGLLCCALFAQCSTPRPPESFAAAEAREAPRGERADSGADAARPDASSSQDAARVSAEASDAAQATQTGTEASGVSALSAEVEARVREVCGELPTETGEFSREKLREAAGSCAVYHYCAFGVSADALQAAVGQYAREPSEEPLRAARLAYRDSLLRWSRAELFQFGPAASAAQSAGRDIYQGKGLRDRIYAWPAVSRCRVEELLADAAPDVPNALISARGLFGLEYALFFSGDGTECAASSRAAMVLAGLSPEALREQKARYAAAVAADVGAQTAQLLQLWRADGGDFLRKLTRAEGYPSEQEALNVLGWALIYVEREVKDWKLGIPAGYTMTAPVNVSESPFALLGTEAMRENLRGFRALFQGCGRDGEGLGFDDWLESAGHGELAQDMLAAYGRAQQTLDELPRSGEVSQAQLETAYLRLRELTALLKGDLFGAGSPLGLKLPATVEGDTD